MSMSKGFMARWSSLKTQSSGATARDGMAGTAPLHRQENAEGSPNLGGDVRPLQTRTVSADLARAALRAAWVADPAIRDHIGIADNQWDFNDPHGMPGFGPLETGDAHQGLVVRVLAGLGHVSVSDTDRPALTTLPMAEEPGLRYDPSVDDVWLSPIKRTRPEPDIITSSASFDGARPKAKRRARGGALPR